MRTLSPLFALLILCAACAAPTVPPTPTPSPLPTLTPSPTPEPKRLIVCTPEEPDSLYLYGTDSPAARHVWQAIYDGPVDSRNYAHQPVILTELPSLGNGRAVLEQVSVRAGDRVLAADGEVIELSSGVMVENAGGQRMSFEGTPIPMQQMVVTFTLHADLYWSDGMLLTADDSVFSFELASDPATPADKHVIERTAAYRAADVRTVVWRGVPGFVDHFYYLNFWHPLPRHAWGHLSASELLGAELSARRPIGWGAFVLGDWVRGDHLTLVRNPTYFRTPQGLPRLDEITVRFITDPAVLAEELLAGRCDVVAHEAAEAVYSLLPDPSAVETISVPGDRWELLAFGISPSPDHPRVDFFEDARVRQGMTLCIDRPAIAQQVLGAETAVEALHSYVPPRHPLYAGSALTAWGYDPEAGQKLLATAGWYDEDGDGVRESHGLPGVADGTRLQFAYQTSDDPLRVRMAQLIQSHLAGCGVQIVVETMTPEAFLAPGPEGVLLGRRFDLAQLSWRATADPLCDLFLSRQIPAEGRWELPNVAGFLDDEYDTACTSALAAPPGSEEYVAGHLEAQRIFSERLPVLPLFQRPKLTLARPSVLGLMPDPTQGSELWNVEQLDLRR